MAWHMIGTDPWTSTYVLDSEADVSGLPTDGGVGSQAVVMESKDGSGIGGGGGAPAAGGGGC